MENSLKHVAVILDGNRRFAKRLMLEPWKGHEYGAKKVEEFFDWTKEFGIKETTIYCFSLENLNRPKKELSYLIRIFKEFFKKMLEDKRIAKEKIKVRFIGKIEIFDAELQEIMKKIMEKTKNYDSYVINFALGYGGRQEILAAVKKLMESKEEINEKNLTKNLWLTNEPDLIIRTGGEKRTSNFLAWQSAYSEWVFLDKTWPEFSKQDFINCIEEFKKRKRNFGA